MEQPKESRRLAEVAKLFFRLGCLGFGGPAVHIAMMEEEVVRKKQWVSQQHFLDLVGATNLIPGPNSTELTMHIGQERAGWKGLVVAGTCFIVPAIIITGFFGWLYQQYGHLPRVQPFIYGIKPAILAVIVSLMINLGKNALKSMELGAIGVLAAIAVLAGFNEVYVLFAGGAVGVLIHQVTQPLKTLKSVVPLALLSPATGWDSSTNLNLFLTFLKIGSILYGSGYVLFAFLDAELVLKGLLSKQELVDAIAVGQLTPGPVFSSATFIGWQIGGWYGAAAATAGIFLPSFLFVALLNPIIPKLRKSAVFGAFLDAVNVVSVAVILAVMVEIGKTSLLDWKSMLIATLSFIVTFYFRTWNTAFIILGGAVMGYVLYYV